MVYFVDSKKLEILMNAVDLESSLDKSRKMCGLFANRS